MKLKSIFLCILIFCISGLAAWPALANTSVSADQNDLENNIEKIFTRYSYFLDNQYNEEFETWFFASPTYNIPEWSLAAAPRHLMSFATFYKYRALKGDQNAKKKIQNAIRKSIVLQQIETGKCYSFHGAITNFLIIRLTEQIPDLLTEKEIKAYEQFLSYHASKAIKANDTENRAALAAVYWRYIMEYLQRQGIYFEESNFDLLDKKINQSIEETLSADFMYRENQQNDFSLHYHALEAFMLTVYGDWTKNINLVIYGREMTRNLYNLSFENGLLEAEFGQRPAGSNSQTYLMAGLLTKRFKYSDYQAYLQNITGNAFFSDERFENRLEWHSSFENNEIIYHDDYSFANIGELALAVQGFDNTEFPVQYIKLKNQNSFYSKTFNIINQGSKITFFDKVKGITKKIQLSENLLTTAKF